MGVSVDALLIYNLPALCQVYSKSFLGVSKRFFSPQKWPNDLPRLFLAGQLPEPSSSPLAS
jgi:hypothetical protein